MSSLAKNPRPMFASAGNDSLDFVAAHAARPWMHSASALPFSLCHHGSLSISSSRFAIFCLESVEMISVRVRKSVLWKVLTSKHLAMGSHTLQHFIRMLSFLLRIARRAVSATESVAASERGGLRSKVRLASCCAFLEAGLQIRQSLKRVVCGCNLLVKPIERGRWTQCVWRAILGQVLLHVVERLASQSWPTSVHEASADCAQHRKSLASAIETSMKARSKRDMHRMRPSTDTSSLVWSGWDTPKTRESTVQNAAVRPGSLLGNVSATRSQCRSSGSHRLKSLMMIPRPSGCAGHTSRMRTSLARSSRWVRCGTKRNVTLEHEPSSLRRDIMWSLPSHGTTCSDPLHQVARLPSKDGTPSCVPVANNKRTNQVPTRQDHSKGLEVFMCIVRFLETHDVDFVRKRFWTTSISSRAFSEQWRQIQATLSRSASRRGRGVHKRLPRLYDDCSQPKKWPFHEAQQLETLLVEKIGCLSWVKKHGHTQRQNHQVVSLLFRPSTHVEQTICTSVWCVFSNHSQDTPKWSLAQQTREP